jgi:hypothetical protein
VDFVVCTLAVKKNQGRFRHVGSDHSLVRTKEQISEVEHNFVWCGNLDSSETRSEVPGKFRNVVLEKDGEDKLDGSRK